MTGTTNDTLVETLNDLIATCKDGEMEYQTASKDVNSTDLKEAFGVCAHQRALFAEELGHKVVQRGGVPKTGGTVAGALLRGWMTVKSGLMGWCDHAVLVECDRGEHAALRHYVRALGLGLPPDVCEVVEFQHNQIRQAHEQIHALAVGSRA